MNKKLKVLVLALFALSLMAGSAMAATRTWSGAAGDGHWSTAENWDAAPAAGDDVLFPKLTGPYKVTVSGDTVALVKIDFGADANVEIVVEKGKKLNLTHGAALTLEAQAKANAAITGGGTLELAAQPLTVETHAGDATGQTKLNIAVDINQAGAGLPTLTIGDYSTLAFGGKVNGAAKAWNAGAAVPVAAVPEHATLSVNDASQLQEQANKFSITSLRGTLNVAGFVSLLDNAKFEATLVCAPTLWPKIDVNTGAVLELKGKTLAVAMLKKGAAATDIKFEKTGAGELWLKGNGEATGGVNTAVALDAGFEDIVVSGGAVRFMKGEGAVNKTENAAAWKPNPAGARVKVTIRNGALVDFQNLASAMPVKDVNFEVENGTLMVAKASVADVDHMGATEVYTAEAGVLNVQPLKLTPKIAAVMKKDAKLVVKGDQAFKTVTGEGLIEPVKDASLILTEMTKDSAQKPAEDFYFLGTVSGDGGVAFANSEQYYPFLGTNEYLGDTLVFGDAKLVIDEDTNFGKSVLYLRSNEPAKDDKRLDAAEAKVGDLKAIKTSKAAMYGDDVRLKLLKIDGVNDAGKVAEVEVDFAPYLHEPLPSDDLDRRHEGRAALVVDSVHYNVNKAEFPAAVYSSIYSLKKVGDGTLLLLGKGEGGDKSVANGVSVGAGRLWLYHAEALGDNNVQVEAPALDKYAMLHVKNGLKLANNLTFKHQKALFVTELEKANKDNLADVAPAVETTGKVEGAGADFQSVIVQDDLFAVGSGYYTLKASNVLNNKVFSPTIDGKHFGNMTAYFGGKNVAEPDKAVMVGNQTEMSTLNLAKLEDAKIVSPFKPGQVFEMHIPVTGKGMATKVRVERYTGSWGSLGAEYISADKKVVVRGNVNDGCTESMIEVTLPSSATPPEKSLSGQRVYFLKAGEEPAPSVKPDGPEIDAPATVEPGKDVTFTLGKWYFENKELASGDVIDIVWMLDGKDVTSQVKDGKLTVKAPDVEGKMVLKVSGKLKSDPTKELSQEKTVEVKKAGGTPAPSGSSSGGCDAGFAGLGLLLAAPLFLRKRD